MKLRRLKYYIWRTRHKFEQKRDARQMIFRFGLGLIGLALTGVLVLVLFIAILSIGLPNVRDLDKISVAQSTTIYDRESNVLYVKHGGENRQYVSYDQISPYVINATIAIEDDKYWEHPGFDTFGIIRAGINNILHLREEQGGSTITQQYIKNSFLSPEKSYTRKLKELILAIELERTFDKKKILELYLNKIPYGNNAYGIEKAAQVYFNKRAKDLDLAESAVLVSIPKAPTYYNPYGPHKFSSLTRKFTVENLLGRIISSEADLKGNELSRGLIGKNIRIDEDAEVYIQGRSDLVLKRMNKLNYITGEELKTATGKINSIEFKEYRDSIMHPHFVFYVISQLEEKYGKEVVEQGGLKVYTTLDPKMQDIAEKTIKDASASNEKKFNVKNAALVAIDPKSGQILSMVGSRDYFDKSIDGNENVALDYRQPGSSFKPFVYAQAFYNRYGPASVIFDVETNFKGALPKNFDGKFKGPMTIRRALGQSRNIPAIKAYFLAGEQKAIIDLATRMGISFIDPNMDFGWPLAIGAGEVRLIDMVSAFGVFANNGVRHNPRAILKIQNAQGNILEEFKQEEGLPVLDPQIAYLINSILSDRAINLGNNLNIANHVNATKTGTSNRTIIKPNGDKTYLPHDLWALGYTTRLVGGVWTGNNRASEGNLTLNADGYNVSAPIWKTFMTEALKNTPSENFPIPEGIKEVTVASASGKLPGPLTPKEQTRTDVFASFSVPTEIDDSYIQADIDTFCDQLANEFTPEEYRKKITFVNQHDIAPIPEWEKGAEIWIRGLLGQTDAENASVIGPPPSEPCPGRTAENAAKKPTIIILSPPNGTSVGIGNKVSVSVQINAPNDVEKVEFYLDDEFKYRSVTTPYEGLLRLPVGETDGTKHLITAKIFDKAGFVGSENIQVTTSLVQGAVLPLPAIGPR